MSLVLVLGAKARAETIRVRLFTAPAPVVVSGMRLTFQGAARSAVEPVAIPRLKRAKVRLTVIKSKYVWTIEHEGGVVQRWTGPELGVAGEEMRINETPAPATVVLAAESPTHMDVIGQMDIETYLAGVLPAEMPAEWPLEALKAQAVAARSFALERVQNRAGARFHLESSVLDQVFAWPGQNRRNAQAMARVRQALEATAGAILVKNDKPVAAYFHADCGGQTEEARAVWGGGEKHGTAVDGSCPLSPLGKWTWHVPKAELYARLRIPFRLPQDGRLDRVEIAEKSESGRVTKIKIVLGDGTTRLIGGQEFRSVAGFDRMRSTRFELVRAGEAVRFLGQGYGHGVGMCQWGARQMAMGGADFKTILRHYFPKSKISRKITVEGATRTL